MIYRKKIPQKTNWMFPGWQTWSKVSLVDVAEESFYSGFKAWFQCVAPFFEEWMFVLKCVCVCVSPKCQWYRTNCQNKSCSIQNRLRCQGHIFLLPISWQTLSQQLSVVFSVAVSVMLPPPAPRPFGSWEKVVIFPLSVGGQCCRSQQSYSVRDRACGEP